MRIKTIQEKEANIPPGRFEKSGIFLSENKKYTNVNIMVRAKKPTKNIINSEEIITENTAKIRSETITMITKNISTILVKKSLIKVGLLIPYINLNPRRRAEIPLDAVQNRERAEKDRNLAEVLKKTSSKILFAALKDASGKKERKTLIISYSDTCANNLISEIKKVIKGIAEISI